jgi:signal transduction histidine kinase
MKRDILFVFMGIVLAATAVALLLAFVLEKSITSPIQRVLDAAEKISNGDLDTRVATKAPIRELNKFAREFNLMAQSLSDRDKRLKDLNKSYLDLVGFVAHELKGILASTILNAYSVRDGFLGMINFKQRKSLDSVVKNLDYFDATIKNFLNLSRIEKGELTINRIELRVKDEIFDNSMSEFKKLAEEKGMTISNNISKEIKIKADYNLMLIAANNLIGNAVKYGAQGGNITLTANERSGKYVFEVYNDGKPLLKEEADRLFRKFSRLNNTETKKAKGTGLGLFITKEIIEKHGGKIRVEAREKGNAFVFEI